MTVLKLNQSTLDTTQGNLSLISPPAMPLLKNNNNKRTKKPHKEYQQPRHGKGGGGGWGGTVCTVTPLMNECMGVWKRKMSIPTQLDQEFETV